MLSELAVLQSSTAVPTAAECAKNIAAAVSVAVAFDCTVAVDVAIKVLSRIALASTEAGDMAFPEHVFVGCVKPALQLAREHIITLLPSTWRLLLMVLLRVER